MKLTLFLTIIGTLSLSAGTTYSQETKLSLNLENATIKELLTEIKKNSDFSFWYSNNELNDNKRITLSVNNQTIDKILDLALKDQNLSYDIKDNFISIYKPSLIDNQTAAQQQVISGVVIDAKTGETLSGVSVLVEGTTTGVIADKDGKFKITASPDATLVFSFIGYLTEKLKVTGQSDISVKLMPDIKKLEEVVVVGYGTVKRSDATGAVATVNTKTLREVPSANLGQALQGRTAGVEITSTSSRPGDAPRIRIRGERSLQGTNDPLMIVDGIPFDGSLNDLNPDDIVSLNILKDASSTAIYGSRGSNGVIIITTKRGRQGKTQVSYNAYYGVSSVARKYQVYNGPEFQAFRTLANYRSGGNLFTPTEQHSIDIDRQTDWQDLLYEKGYTTNHDIGVSGGNETTQFSIGGGYFDNKGIMPGERFQRYTIRGTVDQTIGKRIKVGLNTMNSYDIRDAETVGSIFSALTLSPLTLPYDTIGGVYQIVPNPGGAFDTDLGNPLYLKNAANWKQQRRRMRSFNSIYGELQILEGLKYRINLGIDVYQDKLNQFYSANSPMRFHNTSQALTTNGDSYNYTIENLINYEKVFKNKHRIGFTGLYSIQEQRLTNLRIQVDDIASDVLMDNNILFAGQSPVLPIPPTQYQPYQKWDLISYMGRFNYSFDNRYALTLTARTDGSSRLAKGHKWHYYPAAALAWNISNESFLKESKAISNLKFRVGYGQTSNTSIDPYQTLGTMNRVPYNFGTNTNVYGYVPNTLPNPDLGWEYTSTVNLGVEFGLFGDRINGSIEVYKQKTNGLLQNQSLPPTLGITGNYLTNVGETENKGIEIGLSTINIKTKSGFTWSMDLNFALNRNKIVKLAGGISQDLANFWIVGQPIGIIYDYHKIGIWQTGETIPSTMNLRPGEIKIEDLNNDGQINAADQKVIGSFQPDWTGGITNRFSYKGIDLSIVSYGRVGGMLVSTIHQPSSYLNTNNGRRNGIKLNYWRPANATTGDPGNPTNDYPQPFNDRENATYGSTLGYFDATYWKIRTITIGYNIPEKIFKRTGATSLRVYLTIDNPLKKALFSPYVKAGGVDPEPNSGVADAFNQQGGSSATGFNRTQNTLVVGGNTPPLQSFIFGINLKF